MLHQKMAIIADSNSAPVHELCLANPNDMSRYSEWDIDFRQIEPGQMESKIFLRSSPRVSLVELHLSRGNHQLGCSPTDSVTFGLTSWKTLHSWQGAKIGTPGLLSFGTRSEFEGVSRPGFVGCPSTSLRRFWHACRINWACLFWTTICARRCCQFAAEREPFTG